MHHLNNNSHCACFGEDKVDWQFAQLERFVHGPLCVGCFSLHLHSDAVELIALELVAN